MTEENVVHGQPATVVPNTCSFGTFIYQKLLENVHKEILFLNPVTDEHITHEEFLQYSCSLAEGLVKYGITNENIAAICCGNCVEYFIPVVACLYKGVPLTPINPSYTESELTHAFSLIEPSIVFCAVETAEKMLGMKDKFAAIKAIIVVNSEEKIHDTWKLTDFIDQYSGRVDIYNYQPVEVNVEEHIAFIMLSSGTTGLAKGVVITHENVNFTNAMFREPLVNVKPELQSQYMLGVLPFFHSYGLHFTINAMVRGQTIVVLKKFDFELHLRCVEKYKITVLTVAPPLMQLYAKNPFVDKYDLSHVEHLMIGAGPVSKEIEEEVKTRTGIKKIGQGYGMTEATVGLTIVPLDREKSGSCGLLLHNLSAVVKDLGTDRNLGPNQDGELCFKGGSIMKGYYKNEAANKEIFTRDGYMRSGDIGHYDEDGYFYIVGRLKELIKYKGYQVAPAELEAVLMTNPKIKDAGVVGLPDIDAGELPMAFVVKQPGASLTEEEVMTFVKEFVSPIKYLRGGVIFINEIPKNPSGKILRKHLRSMLED